MTTAPAVLHFFGQEEQTADGIIMVNQAACCTWRGGPQWRQLTTAFWGSSEHSTPAKIKRHRAALAGMSPDCTLVCLMTSPEQLRMGLFYALLAKRMKQAEVQLVVTHHRLFRSMQALLAELQCPAPYCSMLEMLPLHLLPLEYLYLDLEFPQAPQLHVWCDDMAWAAVQILRPTAQRWTAMPPSSCLAVQPELGHWRWQLHDAAGL